MEKLISIIQFFAEDWQNTVAMAAISASVAIFLTGLLKIVVLNKFDKSSVRKLALFLCGVALTVGVDALYFVCAGMDFAFYLASFAIVIPVEVTLYALYENCLVRDAVDFIAKKFLAAVVPAIANALANSESNDATKLKLFTATEQVKKETKKKIASTVSDNDLQNI